MAGKEQVATVPLPELEPGKSESWVQILPAGTFDLTDHRGPRIWDFVYFSFTPGMTARTSDVAILSAALRRTAILHSALSFFYNTVLVAPAVNAAVALGR